MEGGFLWVTIGSGHRVATVTFRRTFHHDGKISPGWCGWGGARPPPFTISTITYKVVAYPPAERAKTPPPPLFLLYPYMYSVGPWPPPETFLTFLTRRNVTANFYTAGATEERRLEQEPSFTSMTFL